MRGKAAPPTGSNRPSWDHPRVCGEKQFLARCDCRELGSPPRVRGKGQANIGAHFTAGITPACAGKSCPERRSFRLKQDHPRVCGEKDDFLAVDVHIAGITPACAGKRRFSSAFICLYRDHPRVCGEKGWYVGAREYFVGSPPRVRGKGTKSTARKQMCRITPACAGKRTTGVWTNEAG